MARLLEAFFGDSLALVPRREMRHEPDGHVESGRGANAGPKDFIASLNLTGELLKSFPCAARDFQKPGQRRAVQSFPSPRFPQDACT
jgi:hypothetical protein